jgi:anaerobic selenocysteine-containing dehydrogenase
MARRVAYRTCPFCEATCGLELHLDAPADANGGGREEIVLVRGDRDDVFSHGFLCPKGTAIKQLEADPDRLRRPLVRRGRGADASWREADWTEAFALIQERLPSIIEEHGRDAVGLYVGNPAAHNLASLVHGRVLTQALGSTNVFTASTVDQMPKQVSAGLMFGAALSIPIPDLDRTDYLMILGANPYASNGSLCTAPDYPGRLDALRARGGRLVVVDPRRTKTAEVADEHVFVRPGTDALFLFALAHTLFADGLVTLGRLEPHTNGVDALRVLALEFAPDVVAPVCGVDADTIRRLARELAAAERAAVYGRIGTCTQEFGTLASWLVDVLNVLTGNLDREGGAMFTLPAAGSATSDRRLPGPGRGVRFGRRQSRVRGAPEVFGELPVACLAEEIETAGEGRIRALVTVSGNPVLSTPDGARLDRALASLDFMVSVDIYRNETTRHADVILPAPPLLTKGHYDLALYQLAIRNVANYSPPLVDLAPDEMAEWEILIRLGAILMGLGTDIDVDALDAMVARQLVEKAVGRPGSKVEGRDPDELMAALEPRRGPERALDVMLRTGPYGDGFGADRDGLSLGVLEANPHGVDLGPLQPRVPEVLRTETGMIELVPEPIVADVARLRDALVRGVRDGLVLVGRRDLRSNNSWMHNLDVLVKGKPRCTLLMHPADAAARELEDGMPARVVSATGEVVVPVEVADSMMRGVVSLPHGWGHDVDGVELVVAAAHAGVNSNALSSRDTIDPLSGNAVLNGIPVEVAPAGEG